MIQDEKVEKALEEGGWRDIYKHKPKDKPH